MRGPDIYLTILNIFISFEEVETLILQDYQFARLNKIYIQYLKEVLNMDKIKEGLQYIPLLLERYQATMVLAAVGDAMGYQNGHWQFIYQGSRIHHEMMKLTNNQGVSKLRIEPKMFRYSDDTVMHFATAQALIHSDPN